MYQATEPPVSGSPAKLAAEAMEAASAAERGDSEDVSAPEVLAEGMTTEQWTQAAQRAHFSSTNWFDGSVRATLQRNYNHFHSKHAPGSKYFNELYRLRAQFFRPKTRAMTRRSEAAVAVALFSTSDLLDVSTWNDVDKDQRDAAEVAKAILQYRLENTLPWFQTAVGATQDAAIAGRVIARLSWRYRTEQVESMVADEDGQVRRESRDEVLEDRPWIDLVPIENVRFDPACDWRDPVGTSPFWIEMMPMYVGDVKQMIEQSNAEYRGRWYFDVPDAKWWSFTKRDSDSIRQARASGQVDPYEERKGLPDFEVVWVHRYFMRINGTDYTFDMIDTRSMLSRPRPVREVYPHCDYGQRPYVSGTAAVEAHKPIPTAPVGMVAETQGEINELANLRVDGTRHAILGRWLIRRGAQVDVETLKYGVANSVVSTENISNDVKELKQQDVPASAFNEADRLNVDFDDVAGNFSLASIAPNRKLQETVGGMNLLSGDAAQVKEYEIRTFVETFVEPLLNQLYAMEQVYETDEALLRDICEHTDMSVERVLDLLALKVKVRVNVGFNSTSPERRIQRITTGIKAVAELAPEKQQQINAAEVIKEVFGALGYKNGERFYALSESDDPEKEALKQEVAQLTAMLQGRQIEAQSRIEVANITANARLQQAAMDGESRERIAILELQLEAKRLQLEEVDRVLVTEVNEVKRRELILQREALSHEIQQDNREFLMMLRGSAKAEGADEGPMDLPGDDKAGTIARGKFGNIPFAEG
jgi:hypothetical protein